jgi:hypothetical protein
VKVPETVGTYRLVRSLGVGGMGTVYEAEDSASGRRVAIKLVAADGASSPDAVERFRQEGRLASAVIHPRCVFVIAADEDAGRPYIVMELMPGSTLKDLVEKQGPLVPVNAIAKILDVIEGLQEAHRLGVIHRDVKPSNCFLEANGRVKVGDFGLAKSLAEDGHLTKSGSFLGTPLFASPEQIRKEPLDPQTDVYSVAATLYFLLTGQAPFQSNDMAAVVARIVSDTAPSICSIRPHVPAALDKVVLRGLERNRERRWRDLEEFRRALRPFLPVSLSRAGMGLRLGAFLLDWTLLVLPFFAATSYFTMDLLRGIGRPERATIDLLLARTLLIQLIFGLIVVAYFTVLEGIWGWSLGKWFLGLRTCTPVATEPPGLARALLRTVVFCGLIGPGETASLLFRDWGLMDINLNWPFVLLGAWPYLGLGILLSTMRARSGYRGLHEWVSGTRVVQVPCEDKRCLLWNCWTQAAPPSLVSATGLPERLGSFAIQGAMGDSLLLARDAVLGRPVWIWLRPGSAAALDASRRGLSRPSRLRWLTCGKLGNRQWDAFLAPRGQSLPDLVRCHGRLSWVQTCPLVEALTEELVEACQDKTLPRPLSPAQVWVQPEGQLQLLEAFGPTALESSRESDQDRAISLVREIAVLTLEGSPRAPEDAGPIRAPVPPHSHRILHPLLSRRRQDLTVAQIKADLVATGDWPRQVTGSLRAAQVTLLGILLAVPLLALLALSVFGTIKATIASLIQVEIQGEALLLGTLPLVWVLSAFFFRGGLTQRIMGIQLLNERGRPAGRIQCAWRALLVWTPLVGLLWLSCFLAGEFGSAWTDPEPATWKYGMVLAGWITIPILLLAYASLALRFPDRAPHDRLAGTYPLPR